MSRPHPRNVATPPSSGEESPDAAALPDDMELPAAARSRSRSRSRSRTRARTRAAAPTSSRGAAAARAASGGAAAGGVSGAEVLSDVKELRTHVRDMQDRMFELRGHVETMQQATKSMLTALRGSLPNRGAAAAATAPAHSLGLGVLPPAASAALASAMSVVSAGVPAGTPAWRPASVPAPRSTATRAGSTAAAAESTWVALLTSSTRREGSGDAEAALAASDPVDEEWSLPAAGATPTPLPMHTAHAISDGIHSGEGSSGDQ